MRVSKLDFGGDEGKVESQTSWGDFLWTHHCKSQRKDEMGE